MATTIAASFTKLRQNLEITDLQASTVSTRQTSVREAVEKDFVVLKSFLTGSYKRSTMIAPLKNADIDIFIVLDASYYDASKPAALLDSVRATLLKTYPETPSISRNGQAVTITFTDFKVDVVPAFNRQGGGFLIPSSRDGRWISTDPTIHETYVTKSNTDHSGTVAPVIKMIKAWNRGISHSFVSFRPSNRACGSPAHGSPTPFTAGIQLLPPRLVRPWSDDGPVEIDQAKCVRRAVHLVEAP